MRHDADNFHHNTRFLLMLASHFLSDVRIDPLSEIPGNKSIYIYICVCGCVCVCVCVCVHMQIHFFRLKCIATFKSSVAPLREPLSG